MQDPTNKQHPPVAAQHASALTFIREWWKFHNPAALNDRAIWDGGSEDLIDFLLDLRAERRAADAQA